MNCSQHIKNILLSFFPIKTKLFLLSHSKAHQQLNSLSLEHYKIFHELQFSIDKHSNMSLYYDYYISQYPSINKQPLKEIILCRLSEYSKQKQINIDNVHPFSVDIINTIPQNIVLDIVSFQKHNPLINIKNNTNIQRINIYIEKPTIEEVFNICNNINQLYVKEIGFIDEELSDEIEEYLVFDTNFEIAYYNSFVNTLILKEEANTVLQIKKRGEPSKIKYSNFLMADEGQNQTQTINYDNIKTLVVGKTIETFPIIPNLERLTIESSNVITPNNIYSINYPKLKILSIMAVIPVDFLLIIINKHRTIKNLLFQLDSKLLTDFSKLLLSKLLNSIPTLKHIYLRFFISLQDYRDVNNFCFSINNLKTIETFGDEGIDVGKLLNKNKNITNLKIKSINQVSEIKDYDFSKLLYMNFENFELKPTTNHCERIQFMLNFFNLRKFVITIISNELLSFLIDNLYKFKYLKDISIGNIIKYEKVFDIINSITKCSFIEKVSLNIDNFGYDEKNEALILSILNCFEKCSFFSCLRIDYLRFLDTQYLIDHYITSKKVVLHYRLKLEILFRKLCFLPQ